MFNTGEVQDRDWLGLVKTDIEGRMSQYEEGQIEFAILALVKDPLEDRVQELARSVKSLQFISVQLDEVNPDWSAFLASTGDSGEIVEDKLILGPDPCYMLSQEVIDNATLSDESRRQLSEGTATELLERRQALVTSQTGIRMSILAEMECRREDEDKATRRCFDYTPFIMAWLRIHARKGVIQDIIDSIEE